MKLFAVVFLYLLIAWGYGSWTRNILRKIYDERPKLYKEIKGSLPDTFIERGSYSPNDVGLQRRLLQSIYSRENPEIFDPKWLPLLTIMRVIIWAGGVCFLAIAVLIFVYAS